MSCNYAEGLSHYENKGKLGLPEKFDDIKVVEEKAKLLSKWIKDSNHTVVHTGAGVSTSAGIPDFRGPNGVWTLEKKGLKPSINISWDDARPSYTHLALLALSKQNLIHYVVTQNIDGLHMRSGLLRRSLSELHGNMFTDKCNHCKRQFVRSTAATTVGQKAVGAACPGNQGRRGCRGKLFDTILDWEDDLPDGDLELADLHSCAADLSICLGTTLQIVPSGNLPLYTKRRGGKLVICNLQPTKQDKHADLLINTYVDKLLKKVLEILDVPLHDYDPTLDPVRITMDKLIAAPLKNDYVFDKSNYIEWNVEEIWLKDKELLNKVKTKKIVRKRKLDSEKDFVS